MADVRIDLGRVTTTFGAGLLLDAEQTVDAGFDHLEQNLATLTVAPHVLVNGVPQAGNPPSEATTGGVDALTQVTAPLDPRTLFPAAYAHWTPHADRLASPSVDSRAWYPQGATVGGGGPRILLSSINDGLTPVYDTESPGIAVSYSYQGFGRSMSRPAMVFDGGAMAALVPEGTFSECTLALTAVLQSSSEAYYGLFEAQQNDPTSAGEPLVLRWTHGRLDVFQNELRIFSHESHRPAAYPVVIILSLSATEDTGRLLVLDQTRTSRTVNIEDLEFVSLAGVLGALGQGTAYSKYRYPSQMDLLDVALWDEAMDFAEMETVGNLLSLAYGLSPA